jgi:hypothetical protein
VVSTTGQPVPRAMVTLRGQMRIASPNAVTPDAIVAARANTPIFTAETGSDGGFAFEQLVPGPYTMVIQKNGYRDENRSLPLAPGQKLSDLTISLLQQGMIAGKITDDAGDPLPQASVTVLQRAYLRGRWELTIAGTGVAGADGSYAIYVPPGRYYVSAARTERRTVATDASTSTLVTTYFPSATTAATGATIDIASGTENRGVNIRMQRVEGFRVTGKVVAGGNLLAQGQLTLRSAGGMNTITASQTYGTQLQALEGAFQFARVVPGTYLLWLQSGRPDARIVASQMITVTDKDITDITLQAGPGAQIAGVVRNESGTPLPNVRPFILFVPEGEYTPSSESDIRPQADGSFQMTDVGPGAYRFRVGTLAARTYVKAIRYNSQDVTRKPIIVEVGANGSVEIVLASDGSDVTGVVRNEKGEVMPGVSVALWKPGLAADGSAHLGFTATSGTDGSFRIPSVPPGEYRAAAWEGLSLEMPSAQEFRVQFEDDRAARVRVLPGSQQTVELKPIPRAAGETAAAKLQ